ncbi:dihydrofolate reductase family protein [Leptospira kmetyi]|uniref:dihydrofolate reductase family protein n=1 Tax=Leptospira kmetyi TaxID=408139 RepID=UPI00108482B1|nr:dihydrofolate reductase family protein [Leptospira kmetyi]TGK14996.1 dihydrofolate reductase [Leptospira kmetyi]TGK31445.1 dihydrofolate reductase [Leptospira kmetyi]
MRKVVFAINISADGYCGHTGMIADEELHKFFTGVLGSGSQILYGRITYELMVPFWPEVAKNQSESETTNEFARVFDSMEKVLFSTTLKNVEDPNSRLATRSLGDEVIALKKEPGKDILVGSLSIASQLSELRLIDEYHFVVHPVLVGRGPRLFDSLKLQESLMLDFLGSETFPSGTTVLHYKRKT